MDPVNEQSVVPTENESSAARCQCGHCPWTEHVCVVAPPQRHAHLISTIPCALYDYVRWADGRSRFFYMSPQCEDIFEHDAEIIMADNNLFWSLVHPDDLARLHEEDRRASQTGDGFHSEVRIVVPSGATKWIQLTSRPGTLQVDNRRMWSGVILDITGRKQVEQERDRLFRELQAALAEVRVLSGFLPICSSCKKIRDDQGYWNQLESYISQHTDAEFTHSICPDCAKNALEEFRLMTERATGQRTSPDAK